MPPPSHLAFSLVVVLHTPKIIIFFFNPADLFFPLCIGSRVQLPTLFDSQLRQFLKARWVEGLDRPGRQLIGEINAPHGGHK